MSYNPQFHVDQIAKAVQRLLISVEWEHLHRIQENAANSVRAERRFSACEKLINVAAALLHSHFHGRWRSVRDYVANETLVKTGVPEEMIGSFELSRLVDELLDDFNYIVVLANEGGVEIFHRSKEWHGERHRLYWL